MTTVEKPWKVVGTRPVRPDGVDKVTGRAVYGADVPLPIWVDLMREATRGRPSAPETCGSARPRAVDTSMATWSNAPVPTIRT